jgi:hypothetical protein
MIHRLLLVPTEEGDPHRLLVGCQRMQLTMSVGSQMDRLKRRAARPRWVDVVEVDDWRGTQGRVLLDLPPTPESWEWLSTVVKLMKELMDELGAALGGWRVVAVDRDGREVELG